jgi:hypothetical protein
MTLSDKLFDSMFPSQVGRFAAFNRGTALWMSQYRNVDPSLLWYFLKEADSLLVRATSWRQPKNLFDSPKFWALLLDFQRERDTVMARTKREKNWSQNKAEWKGFVDRRLSEAELAACDDWQPDAAEVWALVDDLIQARYRFTLSYSSTTKLATVTIIDDDAERKTGGLALATADEDGASALKAALFKHVTVLGGSWETLILAPTRGKRG